MKQNFINAFEAVMNGICCVAYHSFRFLNGRVGHYRLIQPWRRCWSIFAWSAFLLAFWTFVACPLIEWWSGIVDFLNYVIWG